MSTTPESARQTPGTSGSFSPSEQPQNGTQPHEYGAQPPRPQERVRQGYEQPTYGSQGYGQQPSTGPRPYTAAQQNRQSHQFNPSAQLVQPGYGGVAQQPPIGLALKRRNPWGAWLGLPLITLGVYFYVWYYKIHREMAEFDRRRAVPVAGPMLVLLFLGWTGIAVLVSFFNTGNRIANAQRAAGLRSTCNPWLGLLLCFVFGLQVLYYQVELNKIADAYGVTEGTQIALHV